MRVISQNTNHVVQIRPMRQRALGDGGVEVTQEPIYAAFTPVEQGGFLYEAEKEAAERHFSFPGRTQHEDQATPSDVAYRLSVYDTEEEAAKNGWDAATKELVEDTFRRKALTAPESVMVVEVTPIPAPFPAYDTYAGDPADLVLKLAEDGHDLATVLHYERTFGLKRPEIIAALEQGVEMWAAVSVTA
jgi:hypothetical protein